MRVGLTRQPLRGCLAPTHPTKQAFLQRSASSSASFLAFLFRLVLLRFLFLRFRVRRKSRLEQRAVRAVVNADDAVLAAGSDDLAVAARTDGVKEVRGAAELADVAAVVRVPHPHR